MCLLICFYKLQCTQVPQSWLPVVAEPILKAIQASAAIGLEADESTDIAIITQLDLRVRYYKQKTDVIINSYCSNP